jgi:sn-glycerol 3-phosphate transport system substrate-binding protein
MVRFRIPIVLLAAGALALSACSGSSSSSSSGGGGGSAGSGGSVSAAACPVDALSKVSASAPVTITFWHAMNRANETALQKLIDEYQAQQPKVKVNLINQTGYREAFEKYKAGLRTGDLPDIVQIEDTGTQQMIDTRSIVPMSACIKADHYDTSDFLPRTLSYYSVDKVLYPMPFNVSNPVLYYDRNAFTAAGLDPDQPPATLDQVSKDSEKLKNAGYEYGYGLKLDPWYIEQMSAKAGVPYVNNGNGRVKRATKVAFDNPTGQAIFGWMKAMVDTKLAVTNSAEGPSAFDNLLGIRSKRNAMTIDSSAALGTISQVLSSGEGGGVSLGVGPMPGPPGKGGVLVGGAALYVPSKSSAEQKAAAWDLIKYLVGSAQQAEWAAATGYVPLRESAAKSPTLQALWAKEPGYKVAYDQLVNGVDNVATAGPVIGPYQEVRDAVLAGEQKMFTDGTPAKQALAAAAKDADQAISSYNTRIGG